MQRDSADVFEYGDPRTPLPEDSGGWGTLREVSWEAPEHHHTEKSSDWYWALGIVTTVASVTTIILGNVLFGIIILFAGFVMALLSVRKPKIITYTVSIRGVRIGADFYPLSMLHGFHIDEDHPDYVRLLLRSSALLVPLLVIPVPDDAVEDIEYLLEARLPAEHLQEPLGHKLLEFLGF